MERELSSADKRTLVEIVKITQKRGMEGSQGGWKEFLNVYDKRLGNSLSDPSKRTVKVLADFVRTFTEEEDFKIFKKLFDRNFDRDMVVKVPDDESPEQALVRSTLRHPHFKIDYSFPTHEEGWIITKYRKNTKNRKPNDMVAIDCEMVLCEDGTEGLVKVCVVNRDLEVMLNELVNPERPVIDYRTQITGVSAKDLQGVYCTLPDVQQSLKRILSRGTILIGHGLNNDLKVLKLEHSRVIDTSYIFKYANAPVGRRLSLNNACKFVLGREVRKAGEPHNCLDDACAAMKIVLAKIERKLDKSIPLVQKDKLAMPGSESTKLLIHRIPEYVTEEDLYKVIPGDHKLEIKLGKSVGIYSAVATFKSMDAADVAYDAVSGVFDKDSSGRSQKLVTFKCIKRKTCSMYVRKMTCDSRNHMKERTVKDLEPISNDSRKLLGPKKSKTDNEYFLLKEIENLKELLKMKDQLYQDNVKQIENLKEALSRRDNEVSTLHKFIASLTTSATAKISNKEAAVRN